MCPKSEGWWWGTIIFNIYKNSSVSKIVIKIKQKSNKPYILPLFNIESKTRCSMNDRKYYSALHILHTSFSMLIVFVPQNNKQREFRKFSCTTFAHCISARKPVSYSVTTPDPLKAVYTSAFLF